MAVKFGSDGTIYCNSIKYKYKQTRNLIADGTMGYSASSIVWEKSNASSPSTGILNYGYKSYYAAQLNKTSGIAMLSQPMPTPIAGHKYYGTCMYLTSGTEGTSIGGDTRFEWYIADTNTGHLVFGNKNIHTGSKWKRLSSIQSLSEVTAGSWKIRQFTASSNTLMYVGRHIIIDLTEAFGAGNEPTLDWCDKNIRELETYTLVGMAWNFQHGLWSGSALNALHSYGYMSLDSTFEPREYMYYAIANPSMAEGYINSSQSVALTQGTQYYISYDALPSTDYTSGETLDVYWGIAEPSCGSIPARRIADANGGGGMHEWRRFSWYNNRSAFASGSYPIRLDLDNRQKSMELRLTNIGCSNVETVIDKYNSFNGTSITVADVNKEWCDRWIDPMSSPIIHIGDPTFKTPMFNKDYDIICNDIEIRPEVNEVSILPNGKIICKKLVKTQTY